MIHDFRFESHTAGFEKWSKIMIDSVKAVAAEAKGDDKKGGFFGLF